MSNIFVISSVINADKLSVYNDEQRLKQTIQTIKSIDKYCPNNVKYLFDVSVREPNKQIVDLLKSYSVHYVYNGNDAAKEYSKHGLKSLGELNNLYYGLQHIKNEKLSAARIFKISGRYKLNENFVSDRQDFNNSFVFAPALDSWLSKSDQDKVGATKLLRTRLWHMDYSLLDTYIYKLPKIFDDCAKYGIDIEHSHYKNLNDMKIVEIDPIGIEGNIAPNGEFVKE